MQTLLERLPDSGDIYRSRAGNALVILAKEREIEIEKRWEMVNGEVLMVNEYPDELLDEFLAIAPTLAKVRAVLRVLKPKKPRRRKRKSS